MQAQPLLNKQAYIQGLQQEAIDLLSELISIPSYSKQEDQTASAIEKFFLRKGIVVNRYLNNIWVYNQYNDDSKPTILLNSHHDTVKPNSQYIRDPFKPMIEDGKLYGLGSNDAGGALVSLLATFLYYYGQPHLKYNLLFAATAEEEISGTNGIECVLPKLNKIDFGIVGEPTLMQMAVAEKGLLVLDAEVKGKAGHAARDEGENALYKAIKAIEWFQTFQFPKVSDLLGAVKMTVTSVVTENKAHNVVPASCCFVVDVRVNECYTFEEILEIINHHIQADVRARSLRMKSSSISLNHPIVQSGMKLKRSVYGSPTTSDQALMSFPTLKMGPGDSARSHTADEFIYLKELEEGIELYIELLKNILE